MLKAYKYELRPTEEQKTQMSQIFGNVRYVYNWALGIKTTEYQQTGKSPGCFELMRRLTELKKQEDKEWLNNAPSQSLQKSITRLDASFTSFFAKKSKYPKFKSKRDFKESFQCPDNKSIEINFDNWTVRLPKLKWVSFNQDRTFKGKIRQATVSRTATGRHFVSILVEDGKAVPTRKKYNEKNSVGIDVGLKSFAVMSDGEVVANPRHLEKSLKHLHRTQRALARSVKDSKNREKKRLQVAKAHETVAYRRNDFLHKLSTSIAKRYIGVCVEDLNIQGMLRNRRLARHIGQAGWGAFKSMLKYKLERTGGTLIEIGRFEPSSKTCHCCGYVNHELTLSDRNWTCGKCHAKHDRDLNAAQNIKLFGLRTEPFVANATLVA
jgi:putative transposase